MDPLRKIWSRIGPRPAKPAAPQVPSPPEPAVPQVPEVVENEPFPSYPGLTARNVAPGAKLFAERHHLLLALGLREGAVIAEIGVGLGYLSRFLLDHLKPRHFAAIDSFRLHHETLIWGQPSAEIFKGSSHRQWYEREFAHHAQRLDVREGDSSDCLATFADGYFDLIVIDADHGYDGVKRDAEQAVKKAAPHGTLVFEDYVLVDHAGHRYGVVPVVNALVAEGEWQVVGLALQQLMYCSIALRRSAV